MSLGFRGKNRVRHILLSLLALDVIAAPIALDAQAASNEAAGITETYQGVPVGFAEGGRPFRGDPNAPLTVIEYTDYLCPFCQRHFRQTLPALLEKYVRTGRVRYVVHDFPLVSLHPTAPRGAAAARCVGEQGAARFWQMHEALFQAQRDWSRLPDPTVFLAGLVGKIGGEVTAYEACMTSGRHELAVQQSVAAAEALGFTGTPTFQFVHRASGKTYTLVGAQSIDVFARWLDDLLADREPPKGEQLQQAEKQELPFWLKREGLAPDPKRPGFTVGGDRYKGNPNAKLVMVEFADLQCQACQRHTLTTQPVLDKLFVETGEMLWVVKHFPLRAHPHAPVAAAAAECAGDQSEFWAMQHLLFEQAGNWSTAADVDAALVKLAGDLGLDTAQFHACLNGRKALERVLRDLYDGQGVGVRNVPAFILLQGEKATMLVGTRSTEQFASLLRRLLERVESGPASADSASADAAKGLAR